MIANMEDLAVHPRTRWARAAGINGMLLWVHGDPWFKPNGENFAIRVKRQWLDTQCRECGGWGVDDDDTCLCHNCEGEGWHFATEPIK